MRFNRHPHNYIAERELVQSRSNGEQRDQSGGESSTNTMKQAVQENSFETAGVNEEARKEKVDVSSKLGNNYTIAKNDEAQHTETASNSEGAAKKNDKLLGMPSLFTRHNTKTIPKPTEEDRAPPIGNFTQICTEFLEKIKSSSQEELGAALTYIIGRHVIIDDSVKRHGSSQSLVKSIMSKLTLTTAGDDATESSKSSLRQSFASVLFDSYSRNDVDSCGDKDDESTATNRSYATSVTGTTTSAGESTAPSTLTSKSASTMQSVSKPHSFLCSFFPESGTAPLRMTQEDANYLIEELVNFVSQEDENETMDSFSVETSTAGSTLSGTRSKNGVMNGVRRIATGLSSFSSRRSPDSKMDDSSRLSFETYSSSDSSAVQSLNSGVSSAMENDSIQKRNITTLDSQDKETSTRKVVTSGGSSLASVKKENPTDANAALDIFLHKDKETNSATDSIYSSWSDMILTFFKDGGPKKVGVDLGIQSKRDVDSTDHTRAAAEAEYISSFFIKSKQRSVIDTTPRGGSSPSSPMAHQHEQQEPDVPESFDKTLSTNNVSSNSEKLKSTQANSSRKAVSSKAKNKTGVFKRFYRSSKIPPSYKLAE